ncbi:hypothetical protein L7F22_009475 [Adiantum nelumboides]|nr:hypothetical protein [Adiantum nelumboides]
MLVVVVWENHLKYIVMLVVVVWESIAMDFIFDLLRTQSGHDGIWTIIDRFSKQAYFVPVKKTVKPDHLARLFVAKIFRLHGMPETIVSDRDPRFTSLFWKAIWENIGMRLQFSSSFHPQTDGQSEIANSVVLDLLKSYISDQKTQWKRCLPLVEFAYNNTIHSSTGKAPFEIVEGVRKVPPFLSTKDKILEANEYTRDLDTDFAKVRETLQKSQERQKKAADLHRRDSKLKENDWVLLRFDKARLRQKKGKEELSMRYYGLFQITEQINDISFRLRLPDTWKIHNVFHVNLWKTFGDVPDDGEPDEQPEVEANGEILVPEQELKDEMTTAFCRSNNNSANLHRNTAAQQQQLSTTVQQQQLNTAATATTICTAPQQQQQQQRSLTSSTASENLKSDVYRTDSFNEKKGCLTSFHTYMQAGIVTISIYADSSLTQCLVRKGSQKQFLVSALAGGTDRMRAEGILELHEVACL